jgi:hypothetical protein
MTIYEPYEVEKPFLNTLEWSVVRPFNIIHLCLILVTGLVIYLAYRRYRDRPVEDQDRFLFRLALFGVCLFAFRIFRRVLFYQFSIFTSLPLEICYISLILHPLIIRRPSLFGYHYSYFIALVTGLAFVFVVPDAYQVTIFSAAFIESRIEHIITLLIPVCLILWRRFTPQPRFVLPMMAVMFGLAAMNHGFNWMFTHLFNTPTNYLYTMAPIAGTPLVMLAKALPVPLFYMWPTLPLLGMIWFLTCLPWLMHTRRRRSL